MDERNGSTQWSSRGWVTVSPRWLRLRPTNICLGGLFQSQGGLSFERLSLFLQTIDQLQSITNYWLLSEAGTNLPHPATFSMTTPALFWNICFVVEIKYRLVCIFPPLLKHTEKRKSTGECPVILFLQQTEICSSATDCAGIRRPCECKQYDLLRNTKRRAHRGESCSQSIAIPEQKHYRVLKSQSPNASRPSIWIDQINFCDFYSLKEV